MAFLRELGGLPERRLSANKIALEKLSPEAEEVMSHCSASRVGKWEQRQSSERLSLTFDHDIREFRDPADRDVPLKPARSRRKRSERRS